VSAVVTDVEVTPEQLGPARLEEAKDLVLFGGEYVPLPVGLAVRTEDVRDFEAGP